MQRYVHELQKGDRFQFTTARFEKLELPTGRQEVMACWGVRTPTGKAVDPWMLACRDTAGNVFNFALPAMYDVAYVAAPA